jgi:hypothetical protein
MRPGIQSMPWPFGFAKPGAERPTACLSFKFVDDLTHGESKTRCLALELAIACRLGKRGECFGGLRIHKRGFDVRAAEVDADGEV